MSITPKDLIKLVRFTTGRRIFTMRHVRAAAVTLNLPDVVAHIDQATAHDRDVLDIETHWHMRGVYGRRHAPEARSVDNRVDQAVTGIRDNAQMYVNTAPAGDPVHVAARRFLDVAFPGGAFPITSLPFVDQLAAVERLQSVIATQLSAEASALGMGAMLALLANLTVEYRAVLDRGPSDVDFADVKEARDHGQDQLAVLVALILGHFPRTDDPTHERARTALLTPILDQQEAIRRYLNERAVVPDIDPDTDGEPDAEPGGEPDAEPDTEPDNGPIDGPVVETDSATGDIDVGNIDAA